MSDANFNASKNIGTTTKPRLSLLSSKQSGNIRLKSEEQPDSQITILSTTPDDYANVVNVNTIEQVQQQQPTETSRGLDQQQPLLTQEQESQRLNEGAQNKEANKMNISKEDLIRLLSMLKSELQSKEIALAAIKCEQLKRLINPVEISRSSLANTYIELQDRFKHRDQNNNTKKNRGAQHSSASTEEQRTGIPELTKKMTQDSNNEESDRESLNILNTLLELLDRHPLLALPRDSIYCLDYNCNELSTKNFLNLKIQHLDNLINQHRRFRYYMNERLKRSEQRYLELTRELELERSSKFENEKMMFKTSGRAILLKHLDQLKEAYEKEKSDKHAIVMTLLNELLDERERADELVKKLAAKEVIAANSIEKSTGEKEKLIMAEAELLNMQQSMVFSKERNELQKKVIDLETENKNLRAKLDQQEKLIAAMMKSASISSGTKESNQPGPSSPSRSNTGQKQSAVNRTGSTQGATAPVRSQIGASNTKSSPPSKPPNSSATSANQGSPGRPVTQSVSSNGGPQSTPSTSRQATSSSASSTNQRSPAPPVVSRLLGGSSGTESHPIRIQPLFKSASVLSTNQQAKNLKTSTNSTNSCSVSSSISSTGSLNSGNVSVALPRGAMSSNQPVTKPQVPAKPAQLLDQQRNSFN